MKNINIFILFIVVAFTVACGGLKESTTNEEALSDDQISYNNSIEPIMSNFCVTCHSGSNPSAGLNLKTFEEVKRYTENGKITHRINDAKNPMPPNRMLPKEARLAIKKWAENGYRETLETSDQNQTNVEEYEFKPPNIKPVDLEQEGFNFFDLMPGHWVGDMVLMGEKIEWFAFDYRPISASHIHGIFEGGTIGNLFTSFFIAELKGTKTIMARNGGVLNGIYRTSYFVLDKVELSDKRKYFRLVDAYGGKDIMWMELEFEGDKLNFNSYTSRFGLEGKPKLHMKFKGQKMHHELSKTAASQFDYPKIRIEKSFPTGLPLPDWGAEFPVITSASYVSEAKAQPLSALAASAGDPITLKDIPHVASLRIDVKVEEQLNDEKIIIYLSQNPLTDESGKIRLKNGYIDMDLFNSILSFPEILGTDESFTFTYLHPGTYHLTLVADINKDGYISKGDITSPSKSITVAPKSEQTITVDNLSIQN